MKEIGETAAIGSYFWDKKDNKTGVWRVSDLLREGTDL